ncbi:MAG TPA: replication-relaxation family protein [Thermoanaerobaculia bacterium]|jgi:hypothetical protein
MHDPRKGARISERDIAALTFIGEGYEVAQYQLHAAIFPNVSAVVVSHFVTRAVRNSWIAVERWNRVGINRLRLTARGREVAVRRGVDPISLFVPMRPVATKDVAHTLWINDVRIALRNSGAQFDVVLAAWQLQRRMTPSPVAIPDVLGVRRCSNQLTRHVFVAEIDLGGEGLVGRFLPKLRKLSRLVLEWSEGDAATLLVLTSSARRAATIKAIAGSERISLDAVALPEVAGASGLKTVHELVGRALERSVKSS